MKWMAEISKLWREKTYFGLCFETLVPVQLDSLLRGWGEAARCIWCKAAQLVAKRQRKGSNYCFNSLKDVPQGPISKEPQSVQLPHGWVLTRGPFLEEISGWITLTTHIKSTKLLVNNSGFYSIHTNYALGMLFYIWNETSAPCL